MSSISDIRSPPAVSRRDYFAGLAMHALLTVDNEDIDEAS